MSRTLKDEKAIYENARRLKTLAERDAFLDRVCHGEPKRKARILALLQAHERTNDVLNALLDNPVSSSEDRLKEGPGETIDRYKLLEKIGEGGMAVVYMAEQEQPIRRKVALKIIKLGMDTKQVIARFEAERQALAMMDHPNIAKVFDAGATETGRPYFVMELVTGVSITEYCDANHLNTKERLKLFMQVCNAIQHAHQKGVIHRDIKPSNVMVTMHDGKPIPKVIDFGIAKATNQRLTEKTLFTRYAQIIGTPAYMSPEQAELSDVDIDTRSDIYSLGVLLYELLAGTTPFSEQQLREAGYLEMQRVIREEEPTKPSTKLSTLGDSLTDVAKRRSCSPDLLRKTLRGDLDWIVMKSLEKDRTRRYDSTSQFLSDVERHLSHEPVSAGPPSTWYRMKKFIRRRRGVVAVTTGALTVVVAALIFSTLMYIRSNQARSETELVSDFFTNDLLSSIFPEKAKGQQVTVHYILDHAAGSISEKLESSPLSEAKVRETLGLAYQKLGDYQAAEPHLLRALEIRRQQVGEADPMTLTSLHNLGTLHMDQGLYEDAEVLLLKALEMRKNLLRDEHPDTLASAANLAWLYLCEGRIADGDVLVRNVLDIGDRVLGEEHPVVLKAMATSAFLNIWMFRFKDAHQLASRGFEISRHVLGEEHEQTLVFMTQITWACIFEKQYDTAEDMGTRTLELCRKVLGPDHATTILAMSHLGSIYKDLGQYDKAYLLSSQAVERARRVLGEGHLLTLYFIDRLIMFYDLRRQYDQMEALLAEAIVLCRQYPSLGLLSEEISWRARKRVIALGVLARERFDAGRYAEALSAVTRQEDLCRVLSPEIDEMAPSDLSVQTMALRQLGNGRQAQDALDRLRAKYEDDDFLYEEEHLYRAERFFTAQAGLVYKAWGLLNNGELGEVLDIIEILPMSTDHNDPNGSMLSLRKATARAYWVRGKTEESYGTYGDALDAYETAAAILPRYALPLCGQAQLLATCPLEAFRDGVRAVELATRACESAGWKNARCLNALAAACAETSDFTSAIRWEKTAIGLLSGQRRQQWKADYELRLALYESGRPYHESPPQTLLARWKFDEAVDGQTQDSSGNGLHGKLVGDAGIISDNERGGVLSLDGRAYVDCGNALAFDIQGPLTISAWVRLHTLCDAVVSKGGSAWELWCRGGLARFTYTPERNVPFTEAVAVRGHTDMRDGKWHHVVATYDRTKICVYVDAVLDGSERAVGTIATNPCNIYIGLNPELKRHAWNGLIDDVRIYNYALNETEIKALYVGQELQDGEE